MLYYITLQYILMLYYIILYTYISYYIILYFILFYCILLFALELSLSLFWFQETTPVEPLPIWWDIIPVADDGPLITDPLGVHYWISIVDGTNPQQNQG